MNLIFDYLSRFWLNVAWRFARCKRRHIYGMADRQARFLKFCAVSDGICMCVYYYVVYGTQRQQYRH